jgi:N-acetylneuraminic acid mutarotase
MAAVGVDNAVNKSQQIVFAAGSDNPYNFNGIGYAGIPSQPSSDVFSWDIKAKKWLMLKSLDTKTMDHRGLLHVGNSLYILGGMLVNQQVSNKVITYQYE